MRLLLVLLCLLALPVHAAEPATESAYERVMRTNTLRCGYGISPPLLVQDANTKQLSGLNYDVMMEIGKELGLTIEWTEETGWGNFIEGLKTGRYDAFCSFMWPDAGRTRFLSLAGPVMYDFVEAYVRKDDHRFDGDLQKLNQPTVTLPVVEGDVSVALFGRLFPQAKLLALPQSSTVSDLLASVASSKADAVLLTPGMFKSFNDTNPGVLRKLENVPPSTVYPSYLGVKSGEIQLRDMVQVALRGMIDDGRLRRMADQHDPSLILPKAGH